MLKPASLVNWRTDSVLFFDMRYFIVAEDHDLFELLRCTKDFEDTLLNSWPEAVATRSSKSTSTSDNQFNFTPNFYGEPVEFKTPAYQFFSNSKSVLDQIVDSKQFVFEKILSNWEIHIRPTYTGFFALYFSNKNLRKKVEISRLTKEVEDLLSVINLTVNGFETQISIFQLLGIGIINSFIQSVGFKLHTSIHRNALTMMCADIHSPIKCSNLYMIYTVGDIDSVIFPERKGWSRLSRENKLQEMLKTLPMFDGYHYLRKWEEVTFIHDFSGGTVSCIPSPQAVLIANTTKNIKKNRTSLRITGNITDPQMYPHSVEKIILSTLEIKELAAKVETFSFYLVEGFTEIINNTRSMLFSGDIKFPAHIPTFVEHVSKMRFLFLLCKKSYRSSSWVAPESVRKIADHLFEIFDMPTVLENIDHNLNATGDITSHVDNLYAADLSESSNDLAYLGILLASTPLLLSIISLPSFWADIRQLFFTFLPQLPQDLANDIMTTLNLFALTGTIAVLLVTVFSLYLLFSIRKRLSRSIYTFLSTNRW